MVVTGDTNEALKPMYRIFPIFCLAESLFNVALKELFNKDKSIWDWSLTGRNLFFMFIEGLGYFVIVLLVEY